ncbi:hypothetical protein FWF74_04155 [Candidatus Saccharibacteria bacterium]|nr:hypothetical protein [Candidatus Saccharibacteria bacterium]MCL1962750.1 hypothetical protein [Candidatus Saccharibacteria bacterium]
MDLIKQPKRRRNWGLEILHAVFNIVFAAAVVGAVILFPSDTTPPWLALGLILLSKWRTIAIRPRHWWVSLLSNLPDILLGLGMVVLMWRAAILTANPLPTQITMAVIYAWWLVFLKPQHRKHYVLLQAGLSQFVALSALFSIAFMIPIYVVVILTFIIGFATARHTLGLFEERHRAFLSSIWGLIVAQLAFVAWHWTIAYNVVPGFHIPSFAIIISLIAFATVAMYESYEKHAYIMWKDVKAPVLFSSLATLIITIFFNNL